MSKHSIGMIVLWSVIVVVVMGGILDWPVISDPLFPDPVSEVIPEAEETVSDSLEMIVERDPDRFHHMYFKLHLPEDAIVWLEILDWRGRPVSILIFGAKKKKGDHVARFDAGNFEKTTYTYRLQVTLHGELEVFTGKISFGSFTNKTSL